MWQINERPFTAANNFSAPPRPAVTFGGGPGRPSVVIALEADGGLPDRLDALLVEPVAAAVLRAEADSEEHQRGESVRQQRDEAAREQAVADATLAELEAKRARLQLEAGPGLAEALLRLDRQAAKVRQARDDAAERVRVLDETHRLGERPRREGRASAMMAARVEVAERLEDRRRQLLAAISALLSDRLDELHGIEASLQLARTSPASVAQRVARLLERQAEPAAVS
jgi:hypothetical protein